MTRAEIIFATCVILILAFFAEPAFYQKYLSRGCGIVSPLSNLRQLHMATQQRALDYKTLGGSSILWTCDGTSPITYEQWKATLVGEYLQPEDLEKLLTAPGPVRDACTVFAVAESDPENTVLFASKNWQGPKAERLADEPFKGRGFVVFRKGGDGAVLQPKQIHQTNLIGEGGMHEFLPLK